MRALEQVAVVESGSGMASGHRVKRSMTVKRYFMPSDSSRGPTRSTWRLPKRQWSAAGMGQVVNGIEDPLRPLPRNHWSWFTHRNVAEDRAAVELDLAEADVGANFLWGGRWRICRVERVHQRRHCPFH